MTTQLKMAVLATLCIHFSSQAQQRLEFEDGTTVDVNSADFSYAPIRKAALGGVIMLDGLGDIKLLQGSYLNPEKFFVAGTVGTGGFSAEATVFFSGYTRERRKKFALKYEPAGYRTVKAYVLKAQVEKRKELGAYFSVSDYGHLYNAGTGTTRSDGSLGQDVNNIGFKKLTVLYAGISTVNYWHADINMDDDQQRRGQFLGRAVLAPFITLGAETADTSLNKEQLPGYGARLMYELSNTMTLFGKKKIRGRTNLTLRMGADYYFRKKVTGNSGRSGVAPIFGLGWTYNFS